jgi:hypothetical protein
MPNKVITKEANDVLVALTHDDNYVQSLPVSQLDFDEAVNRMLTSHQSGNKKGVVNCAYHIARIESRRWFNFGLLTNVKHSEDGKGVIITNDSDMSIQCNITDKTFKMYSQLVQLIQKAKELDKKVYLRTSAFGEWNNNEWFDMIQVSFK